MHKVVGVKILRQARRFVLQGNMRTMKDSSFVDALHVLRRTDISNPITPTFFDSIQYFSKSDARERYRFGAFAIVSRRVRDPHQPRENSRLRARA